MELNREELRLQESIRLRKAAKNANRKNRNGGKKSYGHERRVAMALDKHWPVGEAMKNGLLEVFAEEEGHLYTSVGPTLSFMELNGYAFPTVEKGRGLWTRTNKPIK